MKEKKKKILVAISGGVDSAVSLWLLKKKNFDVQAIFLKLTDNYKDSLNSAIKICNKLKIKLIVEDIRNEFNKEIVQDFVDLYEQGKTPNPCVNCNRKIKFKYLFDSAKKNNCQLIATGHYARIYQEQGAKYICQAKDTRKDQSYYLWQLDAGCLDKIIFPLGDYTKAQVLRIAKKEFFWSKVKESQDICFIRKNLSIFLKNKTDKLKAGGEIVDIKGNVIGKHSGLLGYTVGQSERLGQLDHKKMCYEFSKNRVPKQYVIKLDVVNNKLVVGPKKFIYKKRLEFEKTNWFIGFNRSISCLAKIRSTAKNSDCVVEKINNMFYASFKLAQRAICSGQSIVFYQNRKLIGGGIIK